jgi:hypothetical protein
MIACPCRESPGRFQSAIVPRDGLIDLLERVGDF